MMVEQKKLISEIVEMLLKEKHSDSSAAWKVASEYGISYDEFIGMEEKYDDSLAAFHAAYDELLEMEEESE